MNRKPIALMTAVLLGASAAMAQNPGGAPPADPAAQPAKPAAEALEPKADPAQAPQGQELPARKPQQPKAANSWLGLTVEAVPPALLLHLADVLMPGRGVFVAKVAADSPAVRSGVRPGDVIVAINGRPFGSPEEFRAVEAESLAPKVLLDVVHAGAPRRLMAAKEMMQGQQGLPEPVGSVALSYALPQGTASLAGVNGRYRLDAQFLGADGRPKQLLAEGSWDKIAQRVDSLPMDLREAIRRGLSNEPMPLPAFAIPFGR